MSKPRRHIVEPGADVAEKFQEHLNGPKGKAVLDNLEDGETITIENKEHILKINKEKGKGIVDFVGYVHDKGNF
ncbi:MAG: hypothetical protein MUO76_04820 [Anaerolineaceae bacterium]|nr:hypothetical protein [Anaerolineaceae bacterium]